MKQQGHARWCTDFCFQIDFFVWISSFFPEPPLQRPSAGNYTELPLF